MWQCHTKQTCPWSRTLIRVISPGGQSTVSLRPVSRRQLGRSLWGDVGDVGASWRNMMLVDPHVIQCGPLELLSANDLEQYLVQMDRVGHLAALACSATANLLRRETTPSRSRAKRVIIAKLFIGMTGQMSLVPLLMGSVLCRSMRFLNILILKPAI
jgi:hypothetical protein